MKVKGITWLGSPTDRYGEMRRFVTDVLGLRAPVAGFGVDDVASARAEMDAKGVRFIGPIHRDKGFTWSHFFAPDGHVYELTRGSE